MNNNITVRLSLLLLGLLLLFSLAACRQEEPAQEGDADSLWENAIYKVDSIAGQGERTVLIDIEAKGKSITLRVMTNAETLGQALYDLLLINDPAFFDTLNGIKADWNADSAYWAFYKGEQLMNVGVNDVVIEGGEHYRFVYTQ